MALLISTKSLFLLASILIIIALNPVKSDVSEETSSEFNKTSDYVEEKNHSEAIQTILRNFEKTLEENRKLYDELDHVDTLTLEDVEDAVSDSGVTRSTVDTEAEVSTDSSGLTGSVTEEEAGGDNATARSRLACNNTGTSNVTATPGVLLVNASLYQTLLYEEHNASVTNRSQSATCSITLFFASWCEFSAAAAPHYNALARVFPQMKLYAVDSGEHHSLNTQFGVMAVPSIFVFHNGRPLYKYNYSEYNLASFTQTFSLLTGLEPMNVTEPTAEDMAGPVPSVAVITTNYYLVLAWVFTLVTASWHVSKSQWLTWALESVRNAWREAEIQHEHED